MTATRLNKENRMTICGTIKSYDENRESGTIAPEGGGEVLRFKRSAVSPRQSERPQERERFSYEQGKDGAGKNCAVNLRRAVEA